MRSASSRIATCNLVQFENALFEVVDDATRRADQQVDAVGNLLRCFS